MAKVVVGRVVKHTQWTEFLFSIQIEADIQPFEAGQFGRIGLNIEGKPVMRPYSFVNAPYENILEFYYVVVPEGPLSALLPKLAIGSEILINEKATGFLVLSEVQDSEQLWMLSTGTALGPFLSILKGEEVWQRFKNIVLVHAVRYAKELSYQEDIQKLLKKGGEQLQFIPFVSGEKTDFSMSGRIPIAIQNGDLEARASLKFLPSVSQFMLCGNPNMVKDTTDTLLSLGFERNRRRKPGHITVENYW